MKCALRLHGCCSIGNSLFVIARPYSKDGLFLMVREAAFEDKVYGDAPVRSKTLQLDFFEEP